MAMSMEISQTIVDLDEDYDSIYDWNDVDDDNDGIWTFEDPNDDLDEDEPRLLQRFLLVQTVTRMTMVMTKTLMAMVVPSSMG